MRLYLLVGDHASGSFVPLVGVEPDLDDLERKYWLASKSSKERCTHFADAEEAISKVFRYDFVKL